MTTEQSYINENIQYFNSINSFYNAKVSVVDLLKNHNTFLVLLVFPKEGHSLRSIISAKYMKHFTLDLQLIGIV